MSEDKKSRIPWFTILIALIIYILFMLWVNARNENERAQQEFAMQTAGAINERTSVMKSTQEMENKIRNCVGIYEATRYVGIVQCVIGRIVNWKESTEPKDPYTAPKYTLAYFDEFTPNTFYLISSDPKVFFAGYVNRCVRVWGNIFIDPSGIPVLSIYEHPGYPPYVNIEQLPDDICIR